MKASTEAEFLGGSRLNPKGTRWESVGTSWSTGGDEVASEADCTVVSGTRAMPSKSFASVLVSSVCLESARCGETVLVFVSDARSNLKFINLSTTTSRVSVRNINESGREGKKQIVGK
jgi:hypothetical protein